MKLSPELELSAGEVANRDTRTLLTLQLSRPVTKILGPLPPPFVGKGAESVKLAEGKAHAGVGLGDGVALGLGEGPGEPVGVGVGAGVGD